MPAPATSAPIRFSPLLAQAARQTVAEVLTAGATQASGLTATETSARQAQHGPNEFAQEKHHGQLWRLGQACKNPLVLLLAALATVAFATEDFRAGTVMVLIVILGVSLKFVQEFRVNAAAKLKAMSIGHRSLPSSPAISPSPNS